ncbi:hypothetical protein PACILC2_10850 [Paenibacillus cisolokensis]|uniref:ABC transmembrane type-1 domain-containing protein n=1 Tax=Paenibacillus cisolokensis TaxID=1658519 RepID=A0ABQ4N2W0_9BACL|nr:hypothetical protein PACILC2_10850 [Paenibacillus cisolokensis]
MNQRRAGRAFDAVNFVALSFFVLLCLAPFLHILAISLSSARAIMSGEVSLVPVELNWGAYKQVFSDMSMMRSLGFTVLLVCLFTVLCMLMTIAAAYPLSKTRLKGRKPVMFIIIITMFFSGGLIPEYILVRSLHLLDTVWALVLPGLISPFYLIILITFFKTSRTVWRNRRKSTAATTSGRSSALSCRCRCLLLQRSVCSMPSADGTASPIRFCILRVRRCIRFSSNCISSSRTI